MTKFNEWRKPNWTSRMDSGLNEKKPNLTIMLRLLIYIFKKNHFQLLFNPDYFKTFDILGPKLTPFPK